MKNYLLENEIKEIRNKTGMSQKKFSEVTGIPKRTIENWESGKNKCTEYTIKLLRYYVDKELIK